MVSKVCFGAIITLSVIFICQGAVLRKPAPEDTPMCVQGVLRPIGNDVADRTARSQRLMKMFNHQAKKHKKFLDDLKKNSVWYKSMAGEWDSAILYPTLSSSSVDGTVHRTVQIFLEMARIIVDYAEAGNQLRWDLSNDFRHLIEDLRAFLCQIESLINSTDAKATNEQRGYRYLTGPEMEAAVSSFKENLNRNNLFIVGKNYYESLSTYLRDIQSIMHIRSITD